MKKSIDKEMGKLIKKFKSSIQAFKKAWKEVDNPVEKVDPQRVENFVEILDAVHQEAQAMKEVSLISNIAFKQYGLIIDKFFDRMLKAVMPDYLVDMYVQDGKPIPNLEVFINEFNDLKNLKVGKDVRIQFHKKIIGHLIITSYKEGDKIKTLGKEIYAIDTAKGEPYELKKPQ